MNDDMGKTGAVITWAWLLASVVVGATSAFFRSKEGVFIAGIMATASVGLVQLFCHSETFRRDREREGNKSK